VIEKTLQSKTGERFTLLIDNEDAHLLRNKSWRVVYSKSNHTPYVRRYVGVVNGKKTSIYLHREIMCATGGKIVDHINNNGLDNRRCNLRICGTRDNNRNSKKRIGINQGITSVFKGVSNHKGCISKPWEARIRVDGVQLYLGIFSSEEDAAKAYDEAAKKYFGEFALTNEMMGLY
jgi:hypothetical protein